MTPDTHHSKPTSFSSTRTGSARDKPIHSEQPSNTHSLDALSAASSAYEKMSPSSQRSRFQFSLALTLVAPIMVGLALASLGPLEYLSAATIKISGASVHTDGPKLKNLLLQHAWSNDNTHPKPSTTRVWSVVLPKSNLIQLLVQGGDRRKDLEMLRAKADTFVATFAAKHQREKNTKSDGEQVLSTYAKQLEQKLATVQAKIDESQKQISDDPTAQRTQLSQRWSTIRNQFKSSREDLSAASAELGALRSTLEPTHGVVTRNERKRGIEVNRGLVQDLRELRVNLTELKTQMLTVWQQCVVKLDAVETSQQKFSNTLSTAPPHSPAGLAAEKTTTHVQQYIEASAAFRSQWSQEFAALRQLDVDPLTGNVLAVYRRVRKLLSTFLFDSGRYVTDLRKDIQIINEDPQDEARTHVWRSEAIRHFHELQNAHHKFEFAATELESRDNYKLDMALRSAKGLYRRSKQQIEAIDTTLSATALDRAIHEHHQSLAAAEHRLETIRATYDHIVGQLVTLQDDLQISAGLNETFLKNAMQIEMSKHDRNFAKTSLETTAKQLGKLEALRLAQLGDIELTLMDCAVIDGPLDLAKRLKLGSIGALITLLAVGLGQWWLTKRG